MRTVDLPETNQQPEPNPYGFVGVKYLAEKYHRSQEEVLNLFIDCDYSIQQAVIQMEQHANHDFAA